MLLIMGLAVVLGMGRVAYAEDLITNDELITEDENWIYKYEGTEDAPEITIVAYVGADTEIVVPQRIGKYYVTRIESFETSLSSGFRKDDNILKKITSISLPAGIYDIGDEVFYKMPALTTVKVTPGTDDVPTSCWQPYNGVGARAFSNCPALISVELPKHIASISEEAFLGCEALVSVDGLSEELKSVGKGAFYRCGKLESLTLPDSVETIGARAFNECVSMKEIVLPKELEAIEASTFSHCESLKELIIPGKVQSIGFNAFEYCTGLESFVVSDNVQKIQAYAFFECDKDKLIVYAAADSIAFLTLDNINEHLHCIPVDVPEGTVLPKVQTIGAIRFMEIGDGITVVGYIGDMEAGVNGWNGKVVTAIAGRVFKDMKITSISIPDTVTGIGDEAFMNCTELKGVLTLPAGLKTLGKGAFSGCEGITEVTIPDSVEMIPLVGFENCKALEKVTIASKADVADDAFHGCNKLTIYTIKGSEAEAYGKMHGLPVVLLDAGEEDPVETPAAVGEKLTVDENKCEVTVTSDDITNPTVAYAGTTAKSAKSVTIPDKVTIDGITYKVTSIADDAFYNNKKVQKITVGANVTTVGKGAFRKCTSLQSVTFKSTKLKKFGANVFSGDKKLVKITLKTTKLGSKSVGSNALKDTNKALVIKVPSSKVSAYKKYFKDKGNKKVKVKA